VISFCLTSSGVARIISGGASTSLLAASRPLNAAFSMPMAYRGRSLGGSPQAVTPGLVQQQVLTPATREPTMPNYAKLFAEAVTDSVRDYFRAHPELMVPGYWLIRRRKRAPQIPARTYLCDHEPGDEENKLDRWPLPILAGEIAGDVADPLDIFGARERVPLKPRPPLKTVEQEYAYRVQDMRHARIYRPDDPLAQPHRAVDLTRIPPISPPGTAK